MSEVFDDIQEGFDAVLENIDKSDSGLMSMKKAELVAVCEDVGLDTEGTKAEIVERLKAYFDNVMQVNSEIVVVKKGQEDGQSEELQKSESTGEEPAKGKTV